MNSAAFFMGMLFAIGLGVSGMTQPQKVLGFLDLAGAWDASLAFVMLGAIGVGLLPFHLYRRWTKPLLADRWRVPPYGKVDRPLLLGAALFGTGWGIAGYCPGPALVSLATADVRVILFVFSMAVGMVVARFCFKTETLRTDPDANRTK
jgi:uncharacterized membrane protein YedE/YeeE